MSDSFTVVRPEKDAHGDWVFGGTEMILSDFFTFSFAREYSGLCPSATLNIEKSIRYIGNIVDLMSWHRSC